MQGLCRRKGSGRVLGWVAGSERTPCIPLVWLNVEKSFLAGITPMEPVVAERSPSSFVK